MFRCTCCTHPARDLIQHYIIHREVTVDGITITEPEAFLGYLADEYPDADAPSWLSLRKHARHIVITPTMRLNAIHTWMKPFMQNPELFTEDHMAWVLKQVASMANGDWYV